MTTTADPDLLAASGLLPRLQAARPERLLWLAPLPCPAPPPGVTVTTLPLTEARAGLAALPRQSLAVLVDPLAALPRREAEALLAALRDLHAEALLLLTPLQAAEGEGWTAADLLALGLRQVAATRHGGRDWRLCHFNLYDYKVTPDWFNPRFWAHPERWDKDWW